MWESLFRGMLEKLVQTGTLSVCLPDRSFAEFGDGRPPQVTVRIGDRDLLRKLVLNPDLAFGEAYMDATLRVDDDDLHGLLGLVLTNLQRWKRPWWQALATPPDAVNRAISQANGYLRAVRNVRHHYDLSRSLYELFLDRDLQYSCAYFRSDADDLDAAQAQKKAHIAAKLLLRPDLRVLDIGCGWGGMALSLARDYGVKVTGITLSHEQHALATERVRAAGLSDRIDIRLMDYREVRGQFDRIVSVGMFEHVGAPNYGTYFGVIRKLLAPDGVALVHTIGRASPRGRTNPFIERHIFPGGYVPALSEMLQATEAEGLWVTDVECLRLHYAKTLRHWIARFDANRAAVEAFYDARFFRMWRFYLVASEQTFRLDRQAVFQVQLSRSIDAVPITRDYMQEPVAAALQTSAAATVLPERDLAAE